MGTASRSSSVDSMVTPSLGLLDHAHYPGEGGAAMVMAHAGETGGLTLAEDFWVDFPEGYRAHQIRLEGGDCSTDSFCYPST